MKSITVTTAALVITLVALIFSLIIVIQQKNKLVLMEKTINVQQKIINLQKEIKDLKPKIKHVQKPKVKVVYKVKDNNLQNDMVIYITKRYTKTSTVIAKAIAKNIIYFSKEYNLPPELILGIVETESMFNPRVRSSAGAIGLMQVMPEWVPKLEIVNSNRELYEVDKGIEAGIQVFLIHLKESKGNISKALYHYVNENHQYVKDVYSAAGRFVAYRSIIRKEEKTKSSDRINTGTDKSSKRSALFKQ